MKESDNTRIVPLNDKLDYALWRICAQAAISACRLSKVFFRLDEEEASMFEKVKVASKIIVCFL